MERQSPSHSHRDVCTSARSSVWPGLRSGVLLGIWLPACKLGVFPKVRNSAPLHQAALLWETAGGIGLCPGPSSMAFLPIPSHSMRNLYMHVFLVVATCVSPFCSVLAGPHILRGYTASGSLCLCTKLTSSYAFSHLYGDLLPCLCVQLLSEPSCLLPGC